VLVVEDEEQLRDALVEMLWSHGFQVVGQAGTGREAISLADSVRPDLVLMDYRMPEMDGVSATEAIRSGHSGTRVVMFSAYDEDSLAADAYRVGASAFLVKGCRPAEIVAALNGALGP
jgi:DNA-binding NarL/FixJ family response regulator